MAYFVIWLIFCFIVGAVGSGKAIGYWKVFFISLLCSPFIGLIIALCSTSIPDAKTYKCNNCQYRSTHFAYYCPRCGKDNEGQTLAENQKRYN